MNPFDISFTAFGWMINLSLSLLFVVSGPLYNLEAIVQACFAHTEGVCFDFPVVPHVRQLQATFQL